AHAEARKKARARTGSGPTASALVGAAVILLTALAVGPLPVLALAFFLASACAPGGLPLRARDRLISPPLGLPGSTFLMPCFARLPVNYPAVWLAVLAIPLLLNWRFLTSPIPLPELRTWSERAAFALLSFGLLMHWLVALKPEQSADGLAMHLAIPAE